MDTTSNYQAAAEVLASAVLDLFPNTLLLGGQGTSRCFFYDFRFSFTVDIEVLRRIEERMQQILRSGVTLEKREMVAANAAEVFKSKGQTFLTQKMKGLQKNVVSFCAIGGHFLDYAPFPFSKGSLSPIKLMKIQELNLLDGKSVRLVGGFLEDKKELKELTSALKSAEDEKLFLPLGAGEWTWLPAAESVKEFLLDRWRKTARKQGFELISTPSIDEPSLLRAHQACFLKRGCSAVAEITTLPMKDYTDPRNGLLEPAKAFTDRLSLTFTPEGFLDSCISCLLFILESLKILGFEFHLFFGSSIAKQAKGYAKEGQQMRAALDKLELEYSVEKQYRSDYAFWIEVRFSDQLGRLWSGPFVALPFALNGVMICSTLGAMERNFGLALEKHGDDVCEFIKREVESEPKN